jgi:hypothetical protein
VKCFLKKYWPLQNKLAHFDHADDYSLVIGCYEKELRNRDGRQFANPKN